MCTCGANSVAPLATNAIGSDAWNGTLPLTPLGSAAPSRSETDSRMQHLVRSMECDAAEVAAQRRPARARHMTHMVQHTIDATWGRQ
jgi:hypothetical protein